MVQAKQVIFDNFQRSVPYFTKMHISRIFKPSSCFKMAYFEAFFNAMTVGTLHNRAVNTKILTRTLQTLVNEKFGKEKVKKKVFFFR